MATKKLRNSPINISPVMIMTDCWSVLIVNLLWFIQVLDRQGSCSTDLCLCVGASWPLMGHIWTPLEKKNFAYLRDVYEVILHKYYSWPTFILWLHKITCCHNSDLLPCILKSCLSSNSKQAAITVFASAVLILIAVVASTVVLLGLLLWAAIK